MNRQYNSRCIFFTSLIIAIMPQVSELFSLTVLHQNDIHSHFDTVYSSGLNCVNKSEKCYGGFSRAVAAVNYFINHDKYSKNLLIVNAGDFYMFNQYYSLFKWRVVADLVKNMPYTAMALGHSEFGDGLDGLLPFMRVIGEKFVCTNINFDSISNETLRAELSRLCPRHRITSYQDGTRHVCLLGYTEPLTGQLLSDSRVVFLKEELALTEEVRAVRRDRPDVKIFVALGHSGYERDKEIAHRVPSLDVIVGGHSHTLLWPNDRNRLVAGKPPDPRDIIKAKDVYPTVVIQPSGRKVVIVQSYRHGKYLGVINVTFNDDDEVVDSFPSPRLLTADMPQDARTEKTLDKYRKKLIQHQNEVQGSTRVRIKGNPTCNRDECNVGNLVTDAILWHIRHRVVNTAASPTTLLAMMNGGAFGWVDTPPGDITLAHIVLALPYYNTVDIRPLHGATIRQMLEHAVEAPLPNQNFLQVSGLRVRYNLSQPQGHRVVSVQVLRHQATPRFEALDDAHVYSVALEAYIAQGRGGFTMLKQHVYAQARNDFTLDIVENYVKRFSPLYPILDGRIQVERAPAVSNKAASAPGWRAGWTAAVAAGSLALHVTLLVRCT